MKRRSFLKTAGTAGLLTLITPTSIIQAMNRKTAGMLEEGFKQPPMSAWPQTWWHWMNGNVTREGITLDLEAMKEAGVGGFQNFDAGTLIPKGPVVYLSPEWIELKKHTIREAERLGLEFTMHNCPGWSSSGGPWITPELAMQQVSWSEAFVAGGSQVQQQLPQPFTKLNYYRDIAVLAYPSLQGETALATLVHKVTNNKGESISLSRLGGSNNEGVAVYPGGAGEPAYLQLEFRQPFEARSLSFVGGPVKAAAAPAGGAPAMGGVQIVLEASQDGQQFDKVATLSAGGGFSGPPEDMLITTDFPAIKARFFRLLSTQPRWYSQVVFSGVERMADWKTKTNQTGGNWRTNKLDNEGRNGSKEHAVDPKSVINISRYVNADGQLSWNAPAGNWTILRIGFTPIGTLNRSAPDTGIGLECDKFSRTAIDFHFNKMMESLIPSLGPLAKKGKVGLLIDSWEVGMQNWTAGFEQYFKDKNGYDILSFLPALTGRYVGEGDTTERFLYDLRRTQADMLADNYYGRFTELCRQHDIISYTEPYDRGPMEEMQIGARVDVNMGEFWNGLSTLFQNNITMRRTTKLAASIAHINGQQVVGAEAFTGEPDSAKWQEHPFMMKPLGDKMFTQGLNRIIFHRYAHQPHPTALPGMTMGPWGIHFDRTNTWWKPGKGWLTYISRCQYLLQQGLFVADLLYFTGEVVGTYTKVYPNELNPTPPQGYDYDLVNAETLLRKAAVKDGRIVLPDGMSYRVLVLQEQKALSLDLLKKLRDMVASGMVLVGAKPVTTPGLRGRDEQAFNALVQEVWGGSDGSNSIEHRLGAGLVYWGLPMGEVLQKIRVLPDFHFSSRSGDAPITYIHRRTSEGDLYFLANQRRTSEDLVCSFRVGNKVPELWDPLTGTTTLLKVYDVKEGSVHLPLQLGPAGSLFVVFRNVANGRRVQALSKDGQLVFGTKPYPAAPQKKYPDVVNNFTISLWVKPELDIMLSSRSLVGGSETWTDYYTIYPPSGELLYGKGHETVGLCAGRNGVTLWTRGAGNPLLTLAAPISISGWSHVAVVYRDATPAVYVNGKLVQQGKPSSAMVHPGLGQASLDDGASYYNGDMSEPSLFAEALGENRIQQLASVTEKQRLYLQAPAELPKGGKAGLLFFEPGKYTLRDGGGASVAMTVQGIAGPQELSGAWMVSFPEKAGAPAQISLPQLMSLHQHSDAGVRYFSGTATYRKSFNVPATALGKDRRLYLDLGRVEVLAEVWVNGKNLGVLWARPYKVDITDAVQVGENKLELKVTNLWPNRLIGDEQVPEPYKFPDEKSVAAMGPFGALSAGGIQELPNWYKEGKPKPEDGRVTFTTWKHYRKDAPLLESGLIGPVVIRFALFKTLEGEGFLAGKL